MCNVAVAGQFFRHLFCPPTWLLDITSHFPSPITENPKNIAHHPSQMGLKSLFRSQTKKFSLKVSMMGKLVQNFRDGKSSFDFFCDGQMGLWWADGQMWKVLRWDDDLSSEVDGQWWAWWAIHLRNFSRWRRMIKFRIVLRGEVYFRINFAMGWGFVQIFYGGGSSLEVFAMGKPAQK